MIELHSRAILHFESIFAQPVPRDGLDSTAPLRYRAISRGEVVTVQRVEHCERGDVCVVATDDGRVGECTADVLEAVSE